MALDDTLAVIVGAGPGNGMAVARRFSREGFRLALIGRDPSKLDVAGLDARFYNADAGDPGSVAETFATITAEQGDPSVMVYNPSYGVEGSPTRIPPAEVTRGLMIGAVGAVASTQAVYPAMEAAGRGTLLFTGGGAGVNPWVAGTVVGMQKAAMRNYALALAEEVAEHGIHAATVTIYGIVKAGTFYDPELIAEEFWRLHSQPRAEWEKEVAYRESRAS